MLMMLSFSKKKKKLRCLISCASHPQTRREPLSVAIVLSPQLYPRHWWPKCVRCMCSQMIKPSLWLHPANFFLLERNTDLCFPTLVAIWSLFLECDGPMFGRFMCELFIQRQMAILFSLDLVWIHFKHKINKKALFSTKFNWITLIWWSTKNT